MDAAEGSYKNTYDLCDYSIRHLEWMQQMTTIRIRMSCVTAALGIRNECSRRQL